jgi:hypothetical protein
VFSSNDDPAAVQIPSCPTATFIRFSSCHRPYDDDVLIFRVDIEGPGLSACSGITTLNGDGLTDFVQALDADFRGWEGERTWTSLEGDLELRATHNGGSIELDWTLWFPSGPHTREHLWSARVPLLITPGEDLKALSVDVRHFIDQAIR